jgi:ferredoxin
MTQPMTQPSEPMTNEPAKAVLRVFTDRSRCCGYGLCAQVCPQVYKLDADGLVYLDSDIVPPGLEEEAREGAAACPAEALRVEFA